PYASMKLAFSSGDAADRVGENRRLVRALLPSEPGCLRQVLGVEVAVRDAVKPGQPVAADAPITAPPGTVATVLTADCMPLFLTDSAGSRVAAVHAGWRGMAAGVIENAVRALGVAPAQVLAWMGPAIGPEAFEVGPE